MNCTFGIQSDFITYTNLILNQPFQRSKPIRDYKLMDGLFTMLKDRIICIIYVKAITLVLQLLSWHKGDHFEKNKSR